MFNYWICNARRWAPLGVNRESTTIGRPGDLNFDYGNWSRFKLS